jgi:hypothetical protein
VVDYQVETLIDNPIYHDQIQEVDAYDLDRYQADGYLPTQGRYQNEEVIVEQPVYYDNIVEQIVQVPVEYIVEQPVEVIRE